MKNLLFAFVAGAICGVAGFALVRDDLPDTNTESSDASAPLVSEAAKEKDALQQQVKRLQAELVEVKGATSEEETEPEVAAKTPLARIGDGINMEAFRQRMEEQQKKRQARAVEAKLASLKARLNLTAEQAEAARELIELQEADKNKGMFKMINSAIDGDGNEIIQALASSDDGEFDFDSEFRNILDEGQVAAYDDYRAQRMLDRIESQANTRLGRLQELVDLTPEQKDQAFEVFAEIAREEVAANPDGNTAHQIFNMTTHMERQRRQREAMSEILSEEQMAVYADAGMGTNVVSTVQLDFDDSTSESALMGAGAGAVLGGITIEATEAPLMIFGTDDNAGGGSVDSPPEE